MTPSRVVAITGASAGIGRAIALRLARDGASLAVLARRAERLEALVSEIRSAGAQALSCPGDVTLEDDLQRLVDGAVDRFGQLDVMICNAGFGIAGAIDTIRPDQMRALLDVNYMGTYLAARAALPIFRRQGHGHLIVMSSIVGKRGVPYMGAYAATKSAQVGMGECLRAEMAGSAIHVSLVYPVSTDTEFFDVMSRATGARVERAFGPRQHAEDVAEAVARAIVRPVAEVYPYRKSRGLVLLNAIAPGWCDRVVKKFGRKPSADLGR